MKKYIYIDDSGNPGLKGSHSERFIIAAVVMPDAESRNELERAIKEFCRGLGWSEKSELKFHKTNKGVIRDVIKMSKKYNYEVYAIVLDKTKADLSLLPSRRKESVMMFVIKELLVELGLDDVEIVVDGSYGPNFIKLAKPYLRQNLREAGAVMCRVRFADSKKCTLIQLADLVAGAVARSYTTKPDAKEYVKLFGKKLLKIYQI